MEKSMEQKAKELAETLNSQPIVYTDENIFDYVDEDDEDDGI